MTKLFRGNPRLLFQAIPVALVVIVLKWLYDASTLPHLELNPLLTGLVAAEVFLIGFMLSGTAGDFKEAERLPGELAASLETVADDLDNPFEYLNGKPGAADVHLDTLEASEDRLRTLLATMGATRP